MKRLNVIESVIQDRPKTIYFYATSHCNSNCSYCVFRTSNKDLPRIHMPLDTIKKIWSESEILKSCGLVIQGGEITTHPEALGIMQFFDKLPIPKITLLTNAVDPEAAVPLIYYANQVTVSLDGPKHDISRGVKGNRENVFRLFDLLRKSSITKTIQQTLGPWNAPTPAIAIENVKWLLDICLEYGAQPRFNIASDDGLLGIAHYQQRNETLLKLAAEMITISKDDKYVPLGESIRNGSNYIMTAVMKSSGRFMACYSTSIYSTINADGNVWLCQGLSEEEAVVGNLIEEGMTFDEIWAIAAETRIDYRRCQKCTLSCQLLGDISFKRAYFNKIS